MMRFFIIFIIIFTSLTAHANKESKTLNMYNWSNFIPPAVIKEFEQDTGISVLYDVYDSDQMLDAKLMSGKTEYDIVVPADSPFLAREIKLDIYQPIDKSAIKNYGYIDPEILKQLTVDDPNNTYSIPWMMNSVGIGYNESKVKEIMLDAPIDSLSIIFDPKYAEKFSKCGIGLLNASTEIISAALTYLQLDPNTSNLEDLNKAKEALLKIRPYIREIDSSSYISNLANNDLCIVIGYSGDILQAIRQANESDGKNNIKYITPKEGFMIAFDMLAIPKHAKHPGNALKFIDFLLRPTITAQVSNYTGFPSTSKESYKFLDDEIKDSKYIFLSPQLLKKSYRSTYQNAEFVRKRNRIWTNFVSSY
jgi:putrescine transport system substrate-binding protein